MLSLKSLIVCDFETDNDINHPNVVSWGCKSLTNYEYGISIESYFQWLKNIKEDTFIFFHNGAKFDFAFILPYMEKFGYKPHFANSTKIKEVFKKSPYKESNISPNFYLQPNEFSYISDDNYKIYEIRIGLNEMKKKRNNQVCKTITFRDSNLMFPNQLYKYGEVLNKVYNTNIYSKGKEKYEDLKAYKNIQEFENSGNSFEYLKQDCNILFEFLKYMNEYLPFRKWKMTAASTAYSEWEMFFAKKIVEEDKNWTKIAASKSKGDFFFFIHSSKPNKKMYLKGVVKKVMDEWFPVKWQDEDNLIKLDIYLKMFYSGGLTHLNNDYKGIILKDDLVCDGFDINSSYPYSLLTTQIPYGNPGFGDDWKLYEIVAQTNLVNEFGLPFIPRMTGEAYVYDKIIEKGTKIRICSTEYENFKKYYKGKYKEKVVLSFQSKKGEFFFGDYVNHYASMKIKADEEKNEGLKIVAKLFLNALYGKFGSKNLISSKIYNPIEEILEDEEILFNAKFYLPVAIATTASSRMLLVNAVGNNYKHFVYTDTDSIFCISKFSHLFNIQLHKTELGKWKMEWHKAEAIFRRAKQYMLVEKEIKYAFAGFRFNEFDKNGNKVVLPTFNDYIEGMTIKEQKKPLKVPKAGKVILDINKEILPIWEFKTEKSDWFYIQKTAKMKKKEYYELQALNFYKNYDKQLQLLKNRH